MDIQAAIQRLRNNHRKSAPIVSGGMMLEDVAALVIMCDEMLSAASVIYEEMHLAEKTRGMIGKRTKIHKP